ncbi:MFS transporter [Amycolatopsis rubida]|uniref:MFS transporter n=1 Tax=Amycolatopsis rubida TaxID=112413 RepID=A0A1I5SJJ9_9PSEU|nr:MFS transporter [Amycolatopsis rubida]MYW97370.1 MFS transporter [Amycolatopsis rubida]NEC62355.1 MFS transporter [Amycolatopsis rubida]SFP70536.1 MFS transporter, putative metabolite:H+ symporter [Amycolatopsis rubida]
MSPSVGSQSRTLVARLDRIPRWPYPKILLWIVGSGYFFTYFETNNLGIALPAIRKDLAAGGTAISLTITSSLLGFVVGAFFTSFVSDRYGRRAGILASLGVISLGSLATAASPNLEWLIAWRLVAGAGAGGAVVTISTYIGELAPAGLRGRYNAWASLFAFVGTTVTPLIALTLVPSVSWGWRPFLLIPIVSVLFLVATRKSLPESPRWLISQGRDAEAEKIIGQAERFATRRSGIPLPPPAPVADEPRATSRVPYGALLRKPFLARSLLLTAIFFLFYLTSYGFASLNPTFINQRGFDLSASIGFVAIGNVGTIAGALLAPWISDRFERKHVVAAASLLTAAGCALLGVSSHLPGLLAGTIVTWFAAAVFQPILYTLGTETFPTRARTAGMGFSDGIGHLGGAVAAPLLVAIHGGLGVTAAYLGMAAPMIVLLAFLPFIPATVRKPLTEINPETAS